MTKTLLIQLNSKFQKEIFKRLVKKFSSSLKAGRFLKIPASSIRGYKNLYFDSIAKEIIDSILDLDVINKKDLDKNTLKIFSREEQISRSLDKGRAHIRNKFLKLKMELPKIKKILNKDSISIKLWLDNYFPFLNTGFRKTEITSTKNNFVASYNNFTKQGFKNFKVNLPKTFKLDEDFLYFFGLWCGDRSGGKKFGICNQCPEILDFTEKFLKNYNQKIEKILYIAKNVKEPQIAYDKKFRIDKEIGGWVLSTHSNNGILASFFKYLQSNLEEFLDYINKKEVFFAGLFDAEGNVSLYNTSFRIACKNEKSIKIYSKFLRQLRLFDSYDGNCLISYNRQGFYKKILPHLKHPKKIELTKFMCTGLPLPEEYVLILNFIGDNPKMNSKGLAKALKKNKIYSELRLLNNFGFISSEGYPSKFEITPKGLKELGEK
jgi:hypothetical protein